MWLQRVGHYWATHTDTHKCSPMRRTLSERHTHMGLDTFRHTHTHTHTQCALLDSWFFLTWWSSQLCSMRRWCDWPPSSELLPSLCMQAGLPLRKRTDRLLHTNWEFQLPYLINSFFFIQIKGLFFIFNKIN